MSTAHRIKINGIRIHHRVEGRGVPVVVVHGGWTDHTAWREVSAALARSHRVVSYDRRGHSRSDRPPGPYARRQHEDDLVALIERVGAAPAHLVGSAYGGVMALSLAAKRPDLVRSVTVHEPAAMHAPVEADAIHYTWDAAAAIDVARGLIETGDVEVGTRHFVERGALGPGAWAQLPDPIKAVFLANAPAFVADMGDPVWAALDTAAVNRFPGSILISRGTASPRWLQLVADALADQIPRAMSATVVGAGHSPHMTHPGAFAQLVTSHLHDPVAARAAA